MEQPLYGEIDVEASKVSVTPRNVFMVIQKKESGFWPRLTKDSGRHLTHIKTDWSKWVVSGANHGQPQALDPHQGVLPDWYPKSPTLCYFKSFTLLSSDVRTANQEAGASG